jgi:hypothetical protein
VFVTTQCSVCLAMEWRTIDVDLVVTFGGAIGQGGAPAAVTPLATHTTQPECREAINQILTGLP